VFELAGRQTDRQTDLRRKQPAGGNGFLVELEDGSVSRDGERPIIVLPDLDGGLDLSDLDITCWERHPTPESEVLQGHLIRKG
jgi:hypothetical protein